MIRAIMFDLDGVLVQSEKLKAQAYAMAVQRILGLSEPDPRAPLSWMIGLRAASRGCTTSAISSFPTSTLAARPMTP